MTETLRRLSRILRRIAAACVLIVAGYGAAGMIGGTIPTNADWREPAQGVPIWIEDNGVHTDIVMPKVAAGVDWRDLAKPGDIADPRYAAFDHVAIGWGERAFFLDTPTWWDVRPRTIIAAAVGSDATLLHVEHVPRPVVSNDVRMIRLTPEQYRRLADFISTSVVTGGRHYRGYAGYDVFYEARGHYDAVRTCNDWTGDALRHAGVRIGAWTPFPVTVTGWF